VDPETAAIGSRLLVRDYPALGVHSMRHAIGRDAITDLCTVLDPNRCT